MEKNENSIKSKTGWTPKLSVLIREDQYFSLERLIPWGWKSGLFQRIIDDLIQVLENPHLREKFLTAIMAGKIKLKHFSKDLEDATKSD